MYEPPITLKIAKEMREELVRNAEEIILKEIVRLGVNVDREELILALQYDRKQYEKGYADAIASVLTEEDLIIIRDALLLASNDWGEPDCKKAEVLAEKLTDFYNRR